MRLCLIDGCGRKHFAHDWCRKHYMKWYNHGDPLWESTRTKPGDPMRYFLAHLDDETDECIEWPYGKDQDGYGVLPPNGRTHVIACTAANGPRPPGMEVSHSCDKPACFNKRHLKWASRLENEQEKTERGRRPMKITEEQAESIRQDYRTTRVIGAEYGISSTQVSLIKRGRRR